MIFKMQNTKAVLFDVDGTLLDTTEYIFQAFEHTLNKHNLSMPMRSEFSKYIGLPLKDIYEIFIPGIDYEILREVHDTFQSNNLHLAKLFSGVLETIAIIKESNIKVAAVTTRGRVNVLDTLRTTGLLDKMELIVSGDDVENHKPHPEPLIKALEYLKVSPVDAYMVGDAEVDILAGKNAGTKTVGVTYGFGGKDMAKHQPDYLINSLSELIAIVGLKHN